MKIVSNQFVGKYALPNHPITCANPAPWLITEMKLECNPIKVWIRGEDSMWFRADQSLIGDKGEFQ